MPPAAARSPGYRLAAGLALAPPSSPAAPSSMSSASASTTDQRRFSALGVSSPSSTLDASPPPPDSGTASFLAKRHGGDDEDEGESEEGLLRRRKGKRSLFSSFSSAAAAAASPALPRKQHLQQQQQQQQRRQGPPAPPPLPRCRLRCRPPLLFRPGALLALAATLCLLLLLPPLADLSGAALYARAPGVSADARFWDRWEASLLREASGGPLALPLEWHWLEAKRELVVRRWRTVAAAAAGSLRGGGGGGGGERAGGEKGAPSLLAFPPALPAFLSSSCSDLLRDYAPLIAADLAPWPAVTRAMVDRDPDRLYLVGGRAFLPREADRGRLMPTFHAFLQRLSLRVALPDLVVPLNVADEPRAPWERGREWGSEHALGDPAALLRGGGAGGARGASSAAEREAGSGKVFDPGDERGNWSSWWPGALIKRKKNKETESGDGKAAAATRAAAAAATRAAAAAAARAASTATGSRHQRSSPSSPRSRHSSPPPNPLFSFCKTGDYADILLPNTIEGDVFVRPRDGGRRRKKPSALPPLDVADATSSEEARRLLLPRVTLAAAASVTAHRKTRAGAADPRPPTAVWRGSTGGFGGLAKGRAALLRLGQQRPDLLDSGVYDWDERRWGPAEGRVKPRMGLADQVDGHKYLVWAPGNCASVRLALQLASDSLVLKIDSSGETEWYYPLLRPFEHYVPIEANETFVGVEEGIAWAEARPAEARAIVLAANAFAEKFLSSRGRYCYAAQLLSEFASRYEGGSDRVVVLPEGAVAVPGVADRPELEEPE